MLEFIENDSEVDCESLFKWIEDFDLRLFDGFLIDWDEEGVVLLLDHF